MAFFTNKRDLETSKRDENSADSPTIQGKILGKPSVPLPPNTRKINTPSKLQTGDQIDRYFVLSPLGEGGMGIVYAAYDPDLNRKVAIKLMHHRGAERGIGKSTFQLAQMRMLHEARSMAQLNHPNVVTIFDVGLHNSQVFLAMELITGTTITKWLQKKNPPWTQILRIFREAGKGLAGAHDAGLTHRDFKPDNVLIANDGQVFVADFGLVYRSNESSNGLRSRSLMDRDAAQINTGINRTPAYMSPKQQIPLTTFGPHNNVEPSSNIFPKVNSQTGNEIGNKLTRRLYNESPPGKAQCMTFV